MHCNLYSLRLILEIIWLYRQIEVKEAWYVTNA
jgi:hypothetical protein